MNFTFFKINVKVRYLVVGSWNTFFAILIFYLFTKFTPHLNYQIILLLSFLTATAQSHFTQRHFVWLSSQAYVPEFLKFLAGTFLFYLINASLLPLLVEGFNFPVFESQLGITPLLLCASYLLQQKFVFK